MGVGAGIGCVGRKTVVGDELVLRITIHDDASACAFWVGGEIHPTTYHVEFLVMEIVGINGEVDDSVGIVWVHQWFFAAVKHRKC